MTNSDAFIQRSARAAESIIADEVTDAMWADYGRMIATRLAATDDLVITLNRAGLRSKSVREMVGYFRAYLLTGTKP